MILHPYFNVAITTKVKNTKSVCNKNHACKSIQKSHICLTKYDHYFVLGPIELRKKMNIKERQVLMRGVENKFSLLFNHVIYYT